MLFSAMQIRRNRTIFRRTPKVLCAVIHFKKQHEAAIARDLLHSPGTALLGAAVANRSAQFSPRGVPDRCP
jgi:hypothetical protein